MLSTGNNCTGKMWPHSSSRPVKHFQKVISKKYFANNKILQKEFLKYKIKKTILLFCSVLFIQRPVGGPHVDAILSCQPLVPWLLLRWCPCFSGCVSRCPSVQFILGRPGFLLYPFNSHCIAWWGILESSIRMTCPNHLSLRSLIMSSSFR